MGIFDELAEDRNALFIAEHQDDFFCFIPLSLAAK